MAWTDARLPLIDAKSIVEHFEQHGVWLWTIYHNFQALLQYLISTCPVKTIPLAVSLEDTCAAWSQSLRVKRYRPLKSGERAPVTHSKMPKNDHRTVWENVGLMVCTSHHFCTRYTSLNRNKFRHRRHGRRTHSTRPTSGFRFGLLARRIRVGHILRHARSGLKHEAK